jgi:antitoxin (DNA-binding transcriptional repressor) of toxin-antitoxin stability system
MTTTSVTLEEASTQLAKLFNLAEQGEEVIIIKNNQSKVRLVAVSEKPQKRVFGQYQGKIHISQDFNEPLPDEFWLGEKP